MMTISAFSISTPLRWPQIDTRWDAQHHSLDNGFPLRSLRLSPKLEIPLILCDASQIAEMCDETTDDILDKRGMVFKQIGFFQNMFCFQSEIKAALGALPE